MKFKTIIILLLGTTVGFTAQAKVCKKGQPCGNSCISWKKTCHKGTYSSYSSPVYSSDSTSNTVGIAGKYVVTANRLNVRDNPFNPGNGNVVGTLIKGEEINVKLFLQGWAMFEYQTGLFWVNPKYNKLL
ncbi:hypothetical protein ABMX65_03535 [Vibrio vulnificus]|uniref:hypothetical protein n=1 Tax=Vibrio vulnificus TaxID=672 RepID=UPI004058E895